MSVPPWLRSSDLNVDDAIVALDASGCIVAMNEEASRLASEPESYGRPFETVFPLRDEFSGRAPTGFTQAVVLPTPLGEIRAFDLIVVPDVVAGGEERGWTIVLRPAVAVGNQEHEAWANLSQGSREGMGIGDPQTGTIGLVSATFAGLYGYTPAELLGKPFSFLFADEDEGLRRTEEQLQSGAVSWEAEHRRKDGSVFPVLMSMSTVRDPIGQARFRAMRVEDITERKAIERREEAQRRLLERVVATVPSVVYLLRLEEGGMRFLSNEVASVLGYPTETSPPVGQPTSDSRFTRAALHPEDREAMLAYRARLPGLADGDAATFEYRIRNAAGGWTWFLSRDTVFERDAGGHVTTILGTATDITETKEAEAREAFLLRLSDALRPISDPVEIQIVASHLLGKELLASRAFSIEVEPDGNSCAIHRDYVDGVPSVAGRHTLSEYEAEVRESWSRGETVVRADIVADRSLSADRRAAIESVQVRAWLGVPLLKDGRLVAILVLHRSLPREWSPQEVELVEETAERTWAATERARTAGALHESELRRRQALDAAALGTYVWDVQEDRTEPDARMLDLLGISVTGESSLAEALAHGLHPDDRARYADAVKRALDPAGDGKHDIEARFIHPDGSAHWRAVMGQTVFEGEPRRAVRMYGTVADIDGRKRREANLAFLAEVNAELAGLTDIEATMEALGEEIGVYFGASLFSLTDIDQAEGLLHIRHNWHRADVPSIKGTYRVEDYYRDEEFRTESRQGKAYVVRDSSTDPRMDAANMEGISVSSYVNVPLVRDGEWLSNLTVADVAPRDWRDDEIELMRELTVRIWTRLERARVEGALRESEVRRRIALDAAEMGTFVWYPEGDRSECDVRLLALYGLERGESINHMLGMAEMVFPEDRARHAEAVAQALDPNGDGALRSEYRITRAGDGAERWIATLGQTQFSSPADGEPRVAISLTGASEDITERKRAEGHQAFRLRLSDTLRSLADPTSIQAETAQLLGEHLGANQVHYGEIVGDHVVIHRGYGNGLPPMVGRFRLLDFGERLIATYRAGGTSVSVEIQADPTISEAERGFLATAGIRAYVGVPLIKGGEWVAALAVHSTTPRLWTDAEIELIVETAERAWAAVERARAEIALRETETLRDVASSAARMAAWVWDFETGEARVWNDEGRIYGFPTAESPGQETRTTIETILSRIVPEDRARMEGAVRRTMEEGIDYEEEVRALDEGHPIWILTKGRRVPNASGRLTLLAGVSIDITERKRAEERQAFLLRLSDTLKSLTDPVAIEEAVTREAMDHFGLDRCYYCEVEGDEATIRRDAHREGWTSVAGTYPLDRFAVYREIVALDLPFLVRDVRTSESVDEELRRICIELEMIAFANVPVVRDGRVVGILCLVQGRPREWADFEIELGTEIAERMGTAVDRARVESDLRESEARLAVVFETLPVGVCVIDVEGAMVISNGEMRRFLPTGVIPSRDGARSALWRSWTTDGRLLDPSRFPGARALGGESVVPGIEMRYVPEDGDGIWVRVASMPLRNDEGQVTGAAVTVTDIDKLKQGIIVPGASEELYRALVGDSPQTVWVADAEGCVVQDSPSWREFTGQTTEAWIGYGWMDAIHPDDREATVRTWMASVKEGLPVDTEYRLWHAGSRSWHRTHVRVRPSRQADGTIQGWIGMNTDLDA